MQRSELVRRVAERLEDPYVQGLSPRSQASVLVGVFEEWVKGAAAQRVTDALFAGDEEQ